MPSLHRHHRLSFLLLLCSSVAFAVSPNPEASLLLQAKLTFDDPNGVLSNWNPGDESPCSWNGVVCDASSGAVVSLDLSSSNLSGPFPVAVCNLKHLSFISLYDNFINSSLPSDSMALCQSLEHLDLSQNYLVGDLPETLADLPNLKYLDLTGNNISGVIPETFGGFKKLEVLSLVENFIEGTIPSFLGNISTLKQLNLSYNPFSPGQIPPELGNLTNLEVLWLTATNLVGEIPESLGLLRRLMDMDLAYNSLTGPIPNSITELTSLVQLELYNNSLSGEIPMTGWFNMTMLRRLDASMNALSGTIPAEMCDLPLESLNLYQNNLHGSLPFSIAKSPNLYELRIFQNQISGTLPPDLGKNSPLRWIDVSTNNFSGAIPEPLCSKFALEELLLIENSFSGGIPETLAECKSLLRVRLSHNKFSGELPAGFWGLPHVSLIELIGNSFSGGISKSISLASNLSLLSLSENNFSGALPEEIGFLDNLLEISINGNKFSGPLPTTIKNLVQLVKFDIHDNELSGPIPSEIRSWKRLNELNLANNHFSGIIPSEVGDLPVLNYLDLSSNQLHGQIPMTLQNLKLNSLNLSYNHLSGVTPPLYAKSMYKDSFLGNPELCGDVENPCLDGVKSLRYIWLSKIVYILAGLVLVFALVWLVLNFRKIITRNRKLDLSKWKLMSFHKLGFSEEEILNALDEDNVIGIGSSGKVYKVVLSNGGAVAVKKLFTRLKPGVEDCDLEKVSIRVNGFDAEVETLGKIRHKNIVKLWCCYTTKDCQLLLYEYMPNGSLGDLLHSTKSGLLTWLMRFKIALDVAEGLAYLHHDSSPPILHRDVKSSNILLDADYGAKVADFGVAKAVNSSDVDSETMSVIAGSCGYIAPEYGYTLRINEKSDVYSFGVVLLELVSGKPAVDPEFGEKDLVKWVCIMLDQKGVDHIIDPKLESCFKDEICQVLSLGMLCTSPLPINRPSMRRVVKMLQVIGGRKSVSKDGKLVPYYYDSDSGSVA